LTTHLNYDGRMDVRGRSLQSGTAFANKGEPSATDMAHLRRNLTDDQKWRLRGIVARSVRSGFGSDSSTDSDA
jgi:hypothetical protein